MIQQVFIAEQDGNAPMLLKELAVAHHLQATPYRYNEKMFENNGLWLKMVGKMPTNICVDADIVGGILPTLPRVCNSRPSVNALK